jgi:hypothetical protein
LAKVFSFLLGQDIPLGHEKIVVYVSEPVAFVINGNVPDIDVSDFIARGAPQGSNHGGIAASKDASTTAQESNIVPKDGGAETTVQGKNDHHFSCVPIAQRNG